LELNNRSGKLLLRLRDVKLLAVLKLDWVVTRGVAPCLSPFFVCASRQYKPGISSFCVICRHMYSLRQRGSVRGKRMCSRLVEFGVSRTLQFYCSVVAAPARQAPAMRCSTQDALYPCLRLIRYTHQSVSLPSVPLEVGRLDVPSRDCLH
jgi:hypothetical protein